jgi:hypothetical protein
MVLYDSLVPKQPVVYEHLISKHSLANLQEHSLANVEAVSHACAIEQSKLKSGVLGWPGTITVVELEGEEGRGGKEGCDKG